MAGKYTITLELGETIDFAVFDEDDNPIAADGSSFRGLNSTLIMIGTIIRGHEAEADKRPKDFPRGGPPGPDGT